MRKNFSLAAFDMDGTFLNSKKEVEAETIRALKLANEAGKVLALDTGRSVAELSLYDIKGMGIRYASCGCGTLIYDFIREEVLDQTCLPAKLIPLLLEVSKREEIMIQAIIGPGSHVSRKDLARIEHFGMGPYRGLYEQVSTLEEDMVTRLLSDPEGVCKLNFYHTSGEARERTRARLAAMELPLDLTDAERTSLEITPRGVSKATGLLALCRLLSIPLEETLAVGDADNDLPMLRAAGLGIAMGNAQEPVRARAGAVVADCDHGGCAEAILKWLLDSESYSI